MTDGTFINFLFVNKCRQRAKKKGPGGKRQYAADNLMCHAVDGKLSLGKVAGSRRVFQGKKRWYGGKAVRQAGLLHLERELENGTIVFGSATAESSQKEKDAAVEELKEVLHDRPIISIDLGVNNEITLVCTWSWVKPDGSVTTSVSRSIISTVTRYDGSGLDRYLEIKMEESEGEDYKECLQKLAQFHDRTMTPEEYEEHINTFEKYGIKILKKNASAAAAEGRFRLANKKRSYWARLPNIILALADAKFMNMARDEKVTPAEVRYKGMTEMELRRETYGSPIIVVGKPTFNACMRGHRPVAPKKTIAHLARFFPVVLVGEYYTSQVCSQCCQYKLKHVEGTKGTRIWYCPNCKMPEPAKKGETHCKNGPAQDTGEGMDCDTSESPGSESKSENDPGKKPRGKKRRAKNKALEEDNSLVVNKDVSAALSLFKIFCCLLATGQRPAAYRPKDIIGKQPNSHAYDFDKSNFDKSR